MSATNQTVDVEPLTNDGVLDDMRVHQPFITNGETVVVQLVERDGELVPRGVTRDNDAALKPTDGYEDHPLMADKAVRGQYRSSEQVVEDITVL